MCMGMHSSPFWLPNRGTISTSLASISRLSFCSKGKPGSTYYCRWPYSGSQGWLTGRWDPIRSAAFLRSAPAPQGQNTPALGQTRTPMTLSVCKLGFNAGIPGFPRTARLISLPGIGFGTRCPGGCFFYKGKSLSISCLCHEMGFYTEILH